MKGGAQMASQKHTLMFPSMSDLTGEKATDPRASNIEVKDSAASRNSVVEMALSFSASIGTSTKDRLKVESSVAPWGTAGVDMMLI